MYRYQNRNTGDIVDRKAPDRRLEKLSNWERIDTEQPAADPVEVKELGEHGNGAPTPPPEPSIDDPDMPARNASRAAWADYAIARGMDEDTAREWKRDQLADHFLPAATTADGS